MLLLSIGTWIWLTRFGTPGILCDSIIPEVGFLVAALAVALLIERVQLLLRDDYGPARRRV